MCIHITYWPVASLWMTLGRSTTLLGWRSEPVSSFAAAGSARPRYSQSYKFVERYTLMPITSQRAGALPGSGEYVGPSLFSPNQKYAPDPAVSCSRPPPCAWTGRPPVSRHTSPGLKVRAGAAPGSSSCAAIAPRRLAKPPAASATVATAASHPPRALRPPPRPGLIDAARVPECQSGLSWELQLYSWTGWTTRQEWKRGGANALRRRLT